MVEVDELAVHLGNQRRAREPFAYALCYVACGRTVLRFDNAAVFECYFHIFIVSSTNTFTFID